MMPNMTPNTDRRLGAALPTLDDLSRRGDHLLTFTDGDEALDSPVRRAAQVARRARKIGSEFRSEARPQELERALQRRRVAGPGRRAGQQHA